MKKMILFLLIVSTSVILLGCGETMQGLGKDTNRMGKGVSTFFFRQ